MRFELSCVPSRGNIEAGARSGAIELSYLVRHRTCRFCATGSERRTENQALFAIIKQS